MESDPKRQTTQNMLGRWHGTVTSVKKDGPFEIQVVIEKDALRIIRVAPSYEILFEEENGCWEWWGDFLIYDQSRLFYVKEATQQTLIFGKLASPHWAAPFNVEWQTVLQESPVTGA